MPELPGCFSQGDTPDEARRNVREAIDAYLVGEDLADLPVFVAIEHVEVEG